tara:strand:+ start:977 stop:1183 length:207 start_codon:yes stop_codon:yes gene_type:complete
MESVTYKKENNYKFPKSNLIPIKVKNEKIEDNDNVLDTSIQRFNPSTSPPMNDFMDRLIARTLVYDRK